MFVMYVTIRVHEYKRYLHDKIDEINKLNYLSIKHL